MRSIRIDIEIDVNIKCRDSKELEVAVAGEVWGGLFVGRSCGFVGSAYGFQGWGRGSD
jgi:hypothetical protein